MVRRRIVIEEFTIINSDLLVVSAWYVGTYV